MDHVLHFFRSIPWFGWVAIVAIVAGAIQGVIRANHRHRERMAMIEMGVDPDASSES